jgi:hypothetical protein
VHRPVRLGLELLAQAVHAQVHRPRQRRRRVPERPDQDLVPVDRLAAPSDEQRQDGDLGLRQPRDRVPTPHPTRGQVGDTVAEQHLHGSSLQILTFRLRVGRKQD